MKILSLEEWDAAIATVQSGSASASAAVRATLRAHHAALSEALVAAEQRAEGLREERDWEPWLCPDCRTVWPRSALRRGVLSLGCPDGTCGGDSCGPRDAVLRREAEKRADEAEARLAGCEGALQAAGRLLAPSGPMFDAPTAQEETAGASKPDTSAVDREALRHLRSPAFQARYRRAWQEGNMSIDDARAIAWALDQIGVEVAP